MEELINGAGAIGLYVIPAVSIMLIARKVLNVPDELFRKILHFILLGAYVPFLFAFETWWASAGVVLGLAILLYPALALAGRIPAFSSFVNERKKGEFKDSMVLALGVMVASISLGWGVLGDRFLVLASVYAWGVGDAFAALIGKKYGKHKITWKFADQRKSVEGSLAMLATSALAVLIVLCVRGSLGVPACALIAVVAAAVSTLVELVTKNGYDTVSCPAAAMAVIVPLMAALGA